ncbi:unnamed protein product [Effrenium voratum]|nr:unnamed protein product [Effrenium voratum]
MLGAVLVDGGFCTARCSLGTPTVPELKCEAGVLTPSFECAAPCVPSTVPKAASPPCAEGLEIPHGQTCTFRCIFGFRAEPSSAQCDRGSLPSFQCLQVAQDCVAPSSAFFLGLGHVSAPGALCASGASVAHGQACQSLCPRGGYSPTPTSLFCSDGQLSPDRFTCGRTCSGSFLADIPFTNPSGTEGSRDMF